MNHGEFLTRLTIWLALCAYAAGAAGLLLANGRASWIARARLVWTLGSAFFLAHVGCAFGFYHHWSHAIAYEDTARQTAETAGFHWGGGIFFNYLFTLAWLGDVLWWWVDPESHRRRPHLLTALWHGFFFFMVFNGTIVFGVGPVRWLGLGICAGLGALWWHKRRRPARAR